MRRVYRTGLIVLALTGCETIKPTVMAPVPPSVPAMGAISVRILWPSRQIQTIPLSAQTIRLSALNGSTVLGSMDLSRSPGGSGPPDRDRPRAPAAPG